MKVEAWLFVVVGVFFSLVAPAYWVIAHDPTGTAALVMAALLGIMVAGYLGFHASRMDPRLEDRKDSEIAEGAGEYGFFPPYSWWPLWSALPICLGVYAIAMGAWWLLIMATVVSLVAVSGWIYEYYRGEHAH